MQPDYTPPTRDEVHAQLDRVLDALGMSRASLVVPVPGGTLNRNYRVQTISGPVFARRWRAGLTAEQIRAEHDLLAWVAARDIPVVQPLKTATGDGVVELPNANWSLFPWIEGRTLVRGQIGTDGAEALGEMHGRIHAALAEHPSSIAGPYSMPPQSVPWDTASSLADLALVRERAVAEGAAREVIEAIDFQVHLLETTRVRPESDFLGSPAQLTHGDYHDQQVLFGLGGEIVAVTDWELYRVMLRVREVIRSLAYSRLLGEPELSAYLRGYGQHVRLSEGECRMGIEAWWFERLHARWVYWTYFMENNRRVAEFFPETASHLKQLADDRWREHLADRFVRAATA